MTRSLLILSSFLLCAIPATQAQQPVHTWSDAFAPAGVDNTVTALAESNGRIYVGGDYLVAGPHITKFAAFDTIEQEWLSLGDVSGGGVLAIAAANDGTIYAGGGFDAVNGRSLSSIAGYNPDTDEWFALGDGITGQVAALAISPSGDLYAGGVFTMAGGVSVQSIARWDGERWYDLSEGGIPSGRIEQMVFEGDVLYVAGDFGSAGGISTPNVARFNTSTMTWAGLGGGISGTIIEGITVNEQGVYVGGTFNTAIQPDGSTLSVNNVARWDPASEQWFALGAGANYGVHAVGSGPDGAIYINGSPFSTTGVLHRWDGEAWDYVNTQESGYNLARIARSFLATEDRLIVGFWLFFLELGGDPHQALYWYEPDEDRWGVYGNAETNGVNEDVLVVIPGPDPGTAYAGGFFRHAGTENVDHVAYWNGTAWESLGRGVRMSDETRIGRVVALHYGSSGLLYVGGGFDELVQTDGATLASRHVAAWNSATGLWQPLGEGANSNVEAITELPDGSIYVGGFFTQVFQSGGEALDVNRIAVWNTTTEQWEAPPEGHDLDLVFFVTSDEAGMLYVGGLDNTDGWGSGRVVRLDPHTQTWEELRMWQGIWLNDIAVYGSPPDDGVLYAALEYGGIWQWHNGIWSQIGGFPNALSLALNGNPLNGGELYAGGMHEGAAGPYIRRLQGGSWHAMGQGITNLYNFSSVYSLAVGQSETEGQAAVWVGGEFTMAGGMPSMCIARWETADYGPSSTENPPALQSIGFEVYPNPTTTQLTIEYELGTSTSASLVIYDLLGRERGVLHDGILQSGSNTLTADVDHLPSGLYILRMTTEDGEVSVRRFTVVR